MAVPAWASMSRGRALVRAPTRPTIAFAGRRLRCAVTGATAHGAGSAPRWVPVGHLCGLGPSSGCPAIVSARPSQRSVTLAVDPGDLREPGFVGTVSFSVVWNPSGAV